MENNSNNERSDRAKGHVAKVLDLRGVTCPMTFVKTKVTLEQMNDGELLQVILDFPAAFRNVPKSVEQQRLGRIVSFHDEGPVRHLLIARTVQDEDAI